MVDIGGRPILWHILKIYSHFGVRDFVICLGYRGYQIKEYFANYVLHNSDVTVDIPGNRLEYHNSTTEPWHVTMVDTGDDTMTGGRLKRIAHHVEDAPEFFMTYGDGVGDVDLDALLRFHRSASRSATMTVVKPPGRFGAVELSEDQVSQFVEKPTGDGGRINGGFFVLSPAVFDLIEGDSTIWEAGPLRTLAAEGQLGAYRHEGFWQPMDTLRDREVLERLWADPNPPWRVWG